MEVLADEDNDFRWCLCLPCQLLQRFLPRRCPRLESSESSLLDSEEPSEEDESDEGSDEDEELELEGAQAYAWTLLDVQYFSMRFPSSFLELSGRLVESRQGVPNV